MRHFSFTKRFKPSGVATDKSLDSSSLVRRLQDLAPILEVEEQENQAKQESSLKENLSIMVGTLHAGEAEFERCKLSVRNQTYKNYKQVFFEGLGEKDAVPAVLDGFLSSDSDVLFRLDADTVLTDKNFLNRVVDIFSARPDLFLLQMAMHDFYSNDVMQGINAYRQNMPLKKDAKDALFTDRTGIDPSQRLVSWTTFADSAIHCPDPSSFQAFHFGVHRGMKVSQYNQPQFDEGNAKQQMIYLEKTYDNFIASQDSRLGFAALGFEQALTELFELNHLNYSNPYLKRRFNRIENWDATKIAAEIELCRRAPALNERVEPLRRQRRVLLQNQKAPVKNLIYLIPKLDGADTKQALELARAFNKEEVEASVCLPDEVFKDYKRLKDKTVFVGLNILTLSSALKNQWDVVLCSDFSSGAILRTTLFRARLNTVYLTDGGRHNLAYLSQVKAARPDVVLSDSRSARPYRGLAPTVIPSEVDSPARRLLDIFNLVPKDLEARVKLNHSILAQLVKKKIS